MPVHARQLFEDTSLFSLLRLIRSEGIGPVTLKKALNRHGCPEDSVAALEAAYEAGKSNKKVASCKAIEQELEKAAELGVQFLFAGHSDYPGLLAALEDAPSVLTAIGDLSLMDRDTIGIVGARNCSAGGTKITRKLAAELSEKGFVIASGLARGIDTAAHGASIEGGTVACLAGGIDVIYPRENTGLYDQIKEKGLLLSEAPIGCKPVARHFPRRNRIISGLSKGVVLIEAAKRSGSLITARYASEQGRDVFVVPGSPLDPRAQGGNALIKNGACLVDCAQDIVDELGTFRFIPTAPEASATATPATNKHEKHFTQLPQEALISFLSPTPIHIDELVRLSGKPVQTLMTELLSLEMTGDIERHSGNLFSRISR